MTPARFIRRVAICLLLMLSCLMQGCVQLGEFPPPVSREAPEAQRFSFRDGGHAIYFTLDRRLESVDAKQASIPVSTYLFIVSGSDCTSMRYFLPQYFHGLEGRFGKIRIFMLHKRFIEAHTWGRTLGCGEAFAKSDHPGRWIADQTEFIHAQLDAARRHQAMPKRVVVMGISEGGDIVPILARNIPGTTHAVILGNGGMDPFDAYQLQAHRHRFSEAIDALDALTRSTPADPDSTASGFGGRSWRYWSELRQITHTRNLLALSIPILMAMGDADQAVPAESATYLRERFQQQEKANLTLLIYPGADHGLRVGGVSRLPEFWRAFDEWVSE